jgi:hypothetical protein
VFWLLVVATTFIPQRSAPEKVRLLGVCIFAFGFVLLLPVMHRDYFYIPGYAVGYKASVSYVGFVFMIGFLLTGIDWTKLARSVLGLDVRLPSLIYFYLAGSAVVRAVALTLPQRFPW